MFSALRRRIHASPATVIASVALVFAMTGGAYAAKKYLITSTKQISPKVLKSLKGANGQTGAQGSPGAAGAQGTQGPAGAAGQGGPPGKDGSNGKDGASASSKSFTGKKTLGSEKCEEGGAEVISASGTTLVCNGKAGEPGEPWTAGGTLPKGATETGTWWVQSAGGETLTSVSFPIPLSASAAAGVTAHFAHEAGFATSCPGTSNKPEAVQGALCFYEAATTSAPMEKPNFVLSPDGFTEAVGTSGVLLNWETTNPGEHAGGSFAVTAG